MTLQTEFPRRRAGPGSAATRIEAGGQRPAGRRVDALAVEARELVHEGVTRA